MWFITKRLNDFPLTVDPNGEIQSLAHWILISPTGVKNIVHHTSHDTTPYLSKHSSLRDTSYNQYIDQEQNE